MVYVHYNNQQITSWIQLINEMNGISYLHKEDSKRTKKIYS